MANTLHIWNSIIVNIWVVLSLDLVTENDFFFKDCVRRNCCKYITIKNTFKISIKSTIDTFCVELIICKTNILEKKPNVGGQPISDTNIMKTFALRNVFRELVNIETELFCLWTSPTQSKIWIKNNVITTYT